MPGQLVLATVVGACLGSFINVLIARYSHAEATLTNRSACPQCAHTLRWWELIPILSFIWLRGRCAHCRQPISWQYPIIEATTAAAWLWAFGVYAAPSIQQVTIAAILTVLILLWAIDARHLLLPDIYIMWLSVFVILHRWSGPESTGFGFIPGILAGSAFLLAVWLITRGQGLGFGDVKLALPLGLLVGGSGIVTILFLAFMAGGLVAVYLLLRRQATLKTAVPFGPYLIAASIAVILDPHLPTALFAPLLG